MKIAVIGTRGIPNHYGGFEQFAEQASVLLAARGYEVTVYNSSLHPYQGNEWKGIRLIKKYDPENKIGTAGQFIYDLNCILHTRKCDYDIILQLGYTSSSIWNFLFKKKAIVITNMDGLEWKRSKYGKITKRFLKLAEGLALKHSDEIIADSKGIASYLQKEYGISSHYIAYGAQVVTDPGSAALKGYEVFPYGYNLLIARFEPENNLEEIIKGHILHPDRKLLLVGNHMNGYGTFLKSKYQHHNIVYTGAIYDEATINALRFYSQLYFHGHSVGGTNPSLLEAMGCGCLIAAHQNEFNESVLGDNAFYFSDAGDISALLSQPIEKDNYRNQIKNNILKIQTEFSWPHIADQLDLLFKKAKKDHA